MSVLPPLNSAALPLSPPNASVTPLLDATRYVASWRAAPLTSTALLSGNVTTTLPLPISLSGTAGNVLGDVERGVSSLVGATRQTIGDVPAVSEALAPEAEAVGMVSQGAATAVHVDLPATDGPESELITSGRELSAGIASDASDVANSIGTSSGRADAEVGRPWGTKPPSSDATFVGLSSGEERATPGPTNSGNADATPLETSASAPFGGRLTRGALLAAEQLLARVALAEGGETTVEGPTRHATTDRGTGLNVRDLSGRGEVTRFDDAGARLSVDATTTRSIDENGGSALAGKAIDAAEAFSTLGLTPRMLEDGSFRTEIFRAEGDNGQRYILVMHTADRTSEQQTQFANRPTPLHAEKAVEIGKVIARVDPDRVLDVSFVDGSTDQLASVAARAAGRMIS